MDKDIDKLLAYIDGKEPKGQFTKDIAAEAERIKQHKETRLEYMTLMMELKEQRREGWEEGMKKGIEKGITDTALSMLKENIPIETIARITNLSTDKILSLR